MKILLIGSPTSIYIKQYIKNVLQPLNMQIFLTNSGILDNDTIDYYKNRNVQLINVYRRIGLLGKIPYIGLIISFRKNIKELYNREKIDIIHIQYVGNIKIMKYAYKVLKNCSKKIILTFWGSDLFDLNIQKSRHIKGLLDVSYKIVLPTESMKEKFRQLYGNIYTHKIETCLFGNPIIDKNIELKFNENEEVDSTIIIPKDKYIISVGYNGSERQQHVKILREISKLQPEIKNNICILLQMGYGMTNNYYLETLIEIMEENEIQYVIIDKYIDEKETIALKKQVDLFIHGQVSDALSSSVLEYLYFKVDVLNPKWINYVEWKRLGIEYVEYEDFSELCRYIEGFYRGEFSIQHDKNAEIIERYFSWENNSNDWKALYL